MIIRIDYPEADVRLDLWGGTSGSFAGLDQFNRVVDQRWQNSVSTTPTDIDRYQYGYDRNSNRTYKANPVGTPVVSSGLDELYAYDPLNRLTEMQRGVLNSTKTAMVGTPALQQNWTLDSTGNWSQFATQASGSATMTQTRTANKVNEITAIGSITPPPPPIGTPTPPAWVTPAYDAAGNTTILPQVTDPTQSYTATYDAWNRMTSVSDSSGTVASYQYDGRNRRIVSTTASETRHYYFTDNWQDIEERVGTSTSMDKSYVWGIRYIDELVCRDDATPQRLYVLQDANFNVTGITDASGAVKERFVYEPYGKNYVLTATWVEGSDSYVWTCRFTGQIYDQETQHYLFRARHFGPALGVFSSRDPLLPTILREISPGSVALYGQQRRYDSMSSLADPGKFNIVDTFNLYQYDASNPISRTDYSGEQLSGIGAGRFGAKAGGAATLLIGAEAACSQCSAAEPNPPPNETSWVAPPPIPVGPTPHREPSPSFDFNKWFAGIIAWPVPLSYTPQCRRDRKCAMYAVVAGFDASGNFGFFSTKCR